ncbi:SusC/RagA family TonB-linked outer membrane protein [Flavivirga spongiicola]|uniref:SusC/RagA family TonB-linked outer membrane protein n=1 Tax=Flavivirga spongiicola TaxID=421621 RepID=A0ABU7XMQ3_9FLAO|nr:SusC/RagA family TonB-linked outer membrane protein [Flavivirga sp. MEBiC05379]MDO5981382.1 SusC/RagA family TonB-linked outer membrane protein [Flavivirga sp. MEBiC05379]
MKKLGYLFIVIAILTSTVYAQEKKTVSGYIYDLNTGEPVVGASVYISSAIIGSTANTANQINGAMIGTTTDFDGNFTFQAFQDAANITVSSMGFETKVIDISRSSTNLVINLNSKNQELEEVLLTGYQKIEKRKVTSAFGKVKTEDIKQAGVSNIDQMLSGQIAGVVVQPTNGAPGAPAKIVIRGIATLNGSSDPLWVLDGIPLEGNDIPSDFTDKDNIDQLRSYAIGGLNPEDIESITILKDASATSIYGARAANGVIVITSKNGKKGPMRINFSANSFVTQRPDFDKLNLMNSNQKVDFELDLASRSDLIYQNDRGGVARILNSYGAYNNFVTNGFAAISLDAQNEINALRKINTNWGDALYQTALNQQYNLSISGGGEKNDYYFSTGFFDEIGATKGTGQKRFNLTIKNNFQVRDDLKIGVSLFGNINKSFSYITGIDANTNPSNYSRRANPYLQVLDVDGHYVYDPDLIERSDLNLKYNILEERRNTSYDLKYTGIKALFDATYNATKGLKLYTQLGLQIDDTKTERFGGEESYFTRKYRQRSQYLGAGGEYAYFLPDGGIIENTNTGFFQYNWKTTATYNTTFKEKHELDVLLGTEFRRNKSTNIGTRAFGFNAKTLLSVPITDERAVGNSAFDTYDKQFMENAYTSFFGTASYTYNRKYTLFGSLRYDGSNLFGVNKKYRYLPLWSLAGSWNITQEDFMDELEMVSDLKFRASYGVQGNIDKSTSPYVVGTYSTTSILPGQTEETIIANGAPNPDLRWEKTVSFNTGLDIGLFNSVIYINSDYYYRKSTDLIGFQSVPLESGYSFINTNWASISNKGFELAITSQNIRNKNFDWITSFNIAHNKNIVEQIEIREEDFKPSRKGYSVNAIFGIRTAGLDSNGLPLFWKNGNKVSAVDFFQLNEGTDGSQLTRQEHRDLYTYLGSGDPKLTGGITNKFRYKQFSLSIAANFNLKQLVQTTPAYDFVYAQPGTNYNTDILKAGTGSFPALIGSSSPGFETNAVYNWFARGDDGGDTYSDLDLWIDEISYIRINSIRLSYAFSNRLLNKLKMTDVRLNLEGRNLFVFGSNYDGYFDPETFGSRYAQPIPKVISLGLNITF